jgi:hypothetical protein
VGLRGSRGEPDRPRIRSATNVFRSGRIRGRSGFPRLPLRPAELHVLVVVQRRPTYKVSFLGGRVPLELRFRGPLEAKSFVRAPKIDPLGAPGRSSILNVDLVVMRG